MHVQQKRPRILLKLSTSTLLEIQNCVVGPCRQEYAMLKSLVKHVSHFKKGRLKSIQIINKHRLWIFVFDVSTQFPRKYSLILQTRYHAMKCKTTPQKSIAVQGAPPLRDEKVRFIRLYMPDPNSVMKRENF